MAGVILFVLGATKLGVMIKYIPFPVVTGFTSGIAIIIMSTQIKDFFGLSETLPSEFTGKIKALLFETNADGRLFFHPHFHLNWPTLALALACTLAIWFWPKKLGRFLPGSMMVVILATTAEALFHLNAHFNIVTLGSRFGELPRSLPAPHWPALSFEEWRALVPAAMTVAVLGAIESLLSAVVADGMIDDHHDSNQELVGQGIANMVMGLFGGMPCTGVIARTATNIRNGGRTPVAGMVHAATVLVILLLAAPLAKNIPLAALAAVLVVVSLRMGEWHRFLRVKHWFQGRCVGVFLRVRADGAVGFAHGSGRVADSGVRAAGEAHGRGGPGGTGRGSDARKCAWPAGGGSEGSRRGDSVQSIWRDVFWGG